MPDAIFPLSVSGYSQTFTAWLMTSILRKADDGSRTVFNECSKVANRILKLEIKNIKHLSAVSGVRPRGYKVRYDLGPASSVFAPK